MRRIAGCPNWNGSREEAGWLRLPLEVGSLALTNRNKPISNAIRLMLARLQDTVSSRTKMCVYATSLSFRTTNSYKPHTHLEFCVPCPEVQ